MANLVSKRFWGNKRVLITGHTGFKGSWLANTLHELGADLIGISLPNKLSPKSCLLKNTKINIKNYYFDICNLKKLEKCFRENKPQIVFHLAAQSLVIQSYKEPKKTFDTNIHGTSNLLFTSLNTPSVKSFINVTTDKVYKNNNTKIAFSENDELGGYDPYSSSKVCSDMIAQTIINLPTKKIKPAVCNVRAGNVIGGGDWCNDRLIPDIVKAYKNNNLLLLRNSSSVRPWQFVLEPLIGYLILAQKSYKEPKRYSGSWNFGPNYKNIFTVNDIVNSSKRYFDSKLKIKKSKIQFKESDFLRINSKKTNELIGWQNMLSLKETLDLTFSWYVEFLTKKDTLEITKKQIAYLLQKFNHE